MTAIVLAGGKRDAVAALEPGAPNKAFVHIAGRTLVQRTIDGLRAARTIGSIVAVVPFASLNRPELSEADELRVDGPRITDSLRAGLAYLDPDRFVLIAPSDVPLLSGAGIDEFVTAVRASDAEIVYACLEKTLHVARYPRVPHTWARLREGTYCGASLIALRPRAFQKLARFIERLGAARKSPLKLAALMGWDVIGRYVVGRLSIAECEGRAHAILGLRAQAFISTHPEIAVNVDRASDVRLAEELVLT